MNKLYLLGAAMLFAPFLLTTQAQESRGLKDAKSQQTFSKVSAKKVITKRSMPKGGELDVYFSDDFSEGISSWDAQGAQDNLWFHTFPSTDPNGYDPDAPLGGAYEDFLPNFYSPLGEGDEPLTAPTRDNGFLMIDADRWNSTTTPDAPGGVSSNPLDATIESPTFSISPDADFVQIAFYQSVRQCCENTSSFTVGLSVDNGDTWAPLDAWTGDANIGFDGLVKVDASSIVQQASDLSQCKIRFSWDVGGSHYYWAIDDVVVRETPDNELETQEVWYNDWFVVPGDAPASEYYDAFEYRVTPEYVTRPLTFGMDVLNQGKQPQTDVTLFVTVTTPSGTVLPDFESDPITIQAFGRDTIYIPEVPFGDEEGEIPIESGEYIFDYRVEQAEDELIPEDNVGIRANRISDDESNDGFAVFSNEEDQRSTTVYTDLTDDVIWSNNYVFTEPEVANTVITHVEVALWKTDDGFAETIAGQLIYFNVRSGAVLDEDEEDPETITTVFFDPEQPLDYDDEELLYEIQEEDIFNLDQDELPLPWTSFLLPNPIMVNAGEVYAAEFRVPVAGGQRVVTPYTNGGEEQFGSLAYFIPDGAWSNLGDGMLFIRFRTDEILSVDEVTYESGIQLLQNYPNPANNITRIQYRLDETSDVTFEVFDITGKLVHSEDHGRIPAGVAQTFNLDVNSLSSGVYTYGIVSNGERVTRKLIVE